MAGKRGDRTALENEIQPILKAYRQRVLAEFPEGSSLHSTLPRLTPLPGATPDAVTANAIYNATEVRAEVNWTESTDAGLASYQVRGVAGGEYEEEDEGILATIPAGAARVFLTDFALGTPGNAVSFKVYVITNTGHERGSNAVTVTRPG